jgi:hypothetical protein
MTLRAGAVAAGVEDVQQGATVIAAPQLSAERFGPAGDHVGDGATMRWQHRRTMRLQITATKATEDVRHLGHASEAAHHLVEQLAQGRPRRLCQMGIDRRGGDVLVAEKHPGLRRGRLWTTRVSTFFSKSLVA